MARKKSRMSATRMLVSCRQHQRAKPTVPSGGGAAGSVEGRSVVVVIPRQSASGRLGARSQVAQEAPSPPGRPVNLGKPSDNTSLDLPGLTVPRELCGAVRVRSTLSRTNRGEVS